MRQPESPRLVAILLALAFPAAATQEPAASAPPAKDVPEAIERGAEILLERQESLDGLEDVCEWPYEGVYRESREIPVAYRVGGTAIAAWALIETPGFADSEDARAAVDRATRFVLDTLDYDRMAVGFIGGYDVRCWGQSYALGYLLRLRAKGLVPASQKEEIDNRIEWLVDTLEAMAIPGTGGWAYSRRGGLSESGPASPFMTAPTLLALYEARRQGVDVAGGVVELALEGLEKARTEKGTIPYSTRGGRDDVEGAIGRTPACEVALHLAGRSSLERIRTSVDDFFEHWIWLEKRRKQTGTHVAPYGNAPYYFFYAHYYAAVAIELLPEAERPERRTKLRALLFQVQEESGGWNDRVFPRSEAFGTSMSILALMQPDIASPAPWSVTAAGKSAKDD